MSSDRPVSVKTNVGQVDIVNVEACIKELFLDKQVIVYNYQNRKIVYDIVV
jgi:hypothetical protein